MRFGFVRTVIKGKIEATPIISSNAIIKIINSNKYACSRSLGVSKNKTFLMICIIL